MERDKFNICYNRYEYINESNAQVFIKEKILMEISQFKNNSFTKIDTFYISTIFNFGNNLIILNNAIFLCEVIGCNTIILNKNNQYRKWLISRQLFIEKLNITIIQDTNIDCKKSNILCIYQSPINFFMPKLISPQIRTDYIKNEILKNLPYINTKSNDLYIHMRGGDIFRYSPSKVYAQPPLCFYQKIINQTTFKNIYIVSMDNLNIIANILKDKYKNIIYNKNNLEFDISLLCHAFNIVLSVSSFSISAIKLNDNLENIWEYDIMKLSQKILFLHHHLFKFKIKYKIHTMKPSEKYEDKMYSWNRSAEQIKLMIEDNCPYDFTITTNNN